MPSQVTLHALQTPSQYPVIALVDSAGVIIDPDGAGGVTSVDGESGAVDLSDTYVQTPDGEPVTAGTIVSRDADEFVEPTPGKNLFDPLAALEDRFWSGGVTPIVLEGWYASDPIPVTPGQEISINNARRVEYLRSDLVYLGEINNTDSGPITFTVPAQCVFLGVGVSAANLTTIQVEVGPEITDFEPYGIIIERQLSGGVFVADTLADVPAVREVAGIAVHRDGDALLVRSQFDATQDILQPVHLAYGANSAVMLATTEYPWVSLVPYSTVDNRVWPTLASGLGTPIHGPGDDNCPVNSGWSYIGGNHGWLAGSQVTATAHGKTSADLGSQWTDGTRTYTLVTIVDANTLLFANQYSVSVGVVTGSTVLPAAPLTHSSGATNTTTVPIAGGTALTQLWPGTTNRSATVTLDGKELPDERKSYGQELTIVETYTIWSYKSFVDTARANIGVSIWTLIDTLGSFGRVSNTYKITRAQVIASQKFTALEAVTLNMGVTQTLPLVIPFGGSVKQFMAGVGTSGGHDWSTRVDLSDVVAQIDIAPADYVDALFPAQRMVQYAYDSDDDPLYGLAVGILPTDDGHPFQRGKNAVSKSWFISASLHKNYPQIAWGKGLAINASLSGTAFRRYLAPPDTTTELVVSDGTDTWAMLDMPTGTTTDARMAASSILGSRLRPIGKPTVGFDDRVDGDGITYSVASAPGYATWRATPDNTTKGAVGATGVPGDYFIGQQGTVTTMALTGSYEILYLCYVDLGADVPVDRACLEVTTLGTGNIRHGVYANDPVTGKPLPTAPLADFGLLDVTGTGIKESTFSTVWLPRGFWYGVVWQTTNTTAPTIRVLGTVAETGPLVLGTVNTGMSAARLGYFIAGVSGALGALGALSVHQIGAPRVAFRKAS